MYNILRATFWGSPKAMATWGPAYCLWWGAQRGSFVFSVSEIFSELFKSAGILKVAVHELKIVEVDLKGFFFFFFPIWRWDCFWECFPLSYGDTTDFPYQGPLFHCLTIFNTKHVSTYLLN